jgi:hypothetical protein
MIVKVLEPAYLSTLRENALSAYEEKVHLKLAKAKEAVVLKECDIKCDSQKAPKDAVAYECWMSKMQTEGNALSVLKAERDALQKAWDDKEHMRSPECNHFIRLYEEEHFHPTEEDYKCVEVPDRKGRSRLLAEPKTDEFTIRPPEIAEQN